MTPSERPPLWKRLGGGRGFPGTLLLTGPTDAALAREVTVLAEALLCPGEDAGRRCDVCRRVAAGLHPDLFLAAPDGVQIRVDRIREAIVFANGRPYESARRVAIVARAELLGAESGNALLKSLEEPGSRFHWILTTTHPESLLPTIRSRCAVARIEPASAAERLADWHARGFSDEDAPDLALLERESEKPGPEELAQYRAFRGVVLEALESGLAAGSLPALVSLAEALPRSAGKGRLLAELLADAAATGTVPADLLPHRAVSGSLQKIARTVPRDALSRAAFKAADAPPDSRRGNRRLHYEAALLELYLARNPAP